MAPSADVFCKTIRRNYRNGAQSKNNSYFEYAAHIASILVLRVLAVRAVPTVEILPVLAAPAAQNPQNTSSAWSSHSTKPRNTASPEVSAVLNLKILRTIEVSADVCKPEILRVHEVPKYLCSTFSRNYFIAYSHRYLEHLSVEHFSNMLYQGRA